MFSLLSQGYGTWDGTAKIDAQEIEDQKDYFSLEDFRLPPIGSAHQKSIKPNVVEHQTGPRYENKPFQLPKMNVSKYNLLPKTYTTRKGALLLYTEDSFLPGSPRPRKKHRKLKRQPSVKLKTFGDLRNIILDYKNGGDPLFLALLQKRLSGYRNHSVRPGYSPKRYIAVLGNSLEQDTWNRLAACGSLKDPGVLTHNTELPPIHGIGPTDNLFADKPQPYSTMSLPPISPASSMVESSFYFYKNGMSTGAASLISLNSEGDFEEYAPSSRAASPTESLSNRLSEVEILPKRRDQYNMLNTKQKEDLLSHLLLQKTLDADLSDLQGWALNSPENEEIRELSDPSLALNIEKPKSKHRGSLKSGSFSSIPRLPPIQSAGSQPTTPFDKSKPIDQPFVSVGDKNRTVDTEQAKDKDQELQKVVGAEQPDEDMLDLDAIQVDFGLPDETSLLNQRKIEDGSDSAKHSEGSPSPSERGLEQENLLGDWSSQEHFMDISKGEFFEGNDSKDNERLSSRTDSIEDLRKGTEDDIVDPGDVIIDDNMAHPNVHNQKERLVQKSEGMIDMENSKTKQENKAETGSSSHASSAVDVEGDVTLGAQETATAMADHKALGSGEEDRTIDLDGEESDEPDGDDEKADLDPTTREIPRESGQQESNETSIENKPSGISDKHHTLTLEELHGEARGIANKVLSRPQSGVIFMEDVRAAMAMWADRLSGLLGPPTQDARVSSAGGHGIREADGVTQVDAQWKVPTRKRKVSRSAAPSLVALRKALQISGGDVPGIEALRNLPPLPPKFTRPSHGHPSSVMSNGHTDNVEVGSTKSNGSSGPVRSIPWERISNADVQVDIFSYASKDEEPRFEQEQAEELDDEESGDEEFQEALSAVVTEVKRDRTLVEAKPKKSVESPKKEEKPFQFPRPAESKPPAGLQNKQTQGGKIKGKEKVAAKKPVAGKRKASKKPTKQKVKAGAKGPKLPVNKENKETIRKDESVTVSDEKEAKIERADEEISQPPVRVDSETGEREVESSEPTVHSSAMSRIMSSRLSSKAAEEISQSKQVSPVEDNVVSAPELPQMIPKPFEPQPPPRDEAKEEHPPPPQEQKPQESRAAKRAAERAAAAERRRLEVERKRREREEAKKRALEEEARLEQIRLEAEEEMKKREEERRRIREEKEEANRRLMDEEVERERLAKVKAEKERRVREEWKRRQQQVIAQRKLEDEMRREQEKIEAELEAARLREEEERIKAMEESERIAFLEKIRREEEELRLRLEQQKRMEEEERISREEAKRQREEALAQLRQKQLQRHLFVSGILREKLYLSLEQRLTRAFTFSYFDLLPWNHLIHLKPGSPTRELLHEVKNKIPPTIVEEAEETEE